MAERLTVNPIESSVTLLNDIFSDLFKPQKNKCGHYSEAVAKALHPRDWRDWYHPEIGPLSPAMFLQDPQKSQLLLDSVNQALETLTPRERQAVRMRFGFEDGEIHTLREVANYFSLTSVERPRQIIAKAERRLRHPLRSSGLRQFLIPDIIS